MSFSALPVPEPDPDAKVSLGIHPLLAMVKLGTGEIERAAGEIGAQIIAALIALPSNLTVDEILDSAEADLEFWYRTWEAAGKPMEPEDDVDFEGVAQSLREATYEED